MAGENAFRDLWDHIPYTEFLDAQDNEYWQHSFQEAFGPGSTKADHDEWMAEYGLDWEDFDWEDFAEWYSEQLAMPQQSDRNLGKPNTLTALTIDDVSAVSAAPMKPRAKEHEDNTRRPFIFWDGEAVKDGGYCLLGASTGDEISKFPELPTEDCLDLILNVGREHRRAFHVAFSFDYDVNNILADLSWRHLGILRETTRVVWRGFKIQHIPEKSFQVSKNGVTVRIDDCFSYFRSRFDKALEKYSIGTEAEREEVTAGKDDRDKFVWADIDRITHYYHLELKLGVELMDYIRRVVNKAGFNVGLWHGSAALAAYAMKQHKMGDHKRVFKVGERYDNAVRSAYAGGWFERYRVGVHRGPVYTADINSAYVYAMSLLPSLASGEWYHIHNPVWRDYSRMRFGLYHVRYNFASDEDWGKLYRLISYGMPAPLFMRGADNSMRHPARVDGWYWTPEAALVANDPHAEITEAWIFDDDGSYPFEWVADMYQERLALQAHNDPAEKALKWALASMYGKTAQRKGWDRKKRLPPTWHQLEWAGWVTAKCRSMVYLAAHDVGKRGGLVSIDTDGVMSTVPFTDGLNDTGIGNQLGRWKVEEFTELVYMQTGFYWLRGCDGEWQPPKTRGFTNTRITSPEIAYEALAGDGKITLRRNTFVKYGAAIRGRQNEWRQWVKRPLTIDVNRGGTKGHSPKMCLSCREGIPLSEALHNVVPIPTTETKSMPHKLPWLQADAPLFSPHEITEDDL